MNVIKGLGTDIVEVKRIARALERHKQIFLDKIYTQKEQSYCTRFSDATPHFAGRFAAKEACAKALGTGIGQEVSWLDLEIINNEKGQPEVILSPYARTIFPGIVFFLSISHSENYASATAIATHKIGN